MVVRPFKPATEPRDLNATDKTRANHIVDRVLALDSAAVSRELADVIENFDSRHRNLLAVFEARAREMEEAFAAHAKFTEEQHWLVGAYFMHEYSFEAAALFNPSIVAHFDQSGVKSGSLRFILSLRAVGEGHISSLTFRTGIVAENGDVSIDATAPFASIPAVVARRPTAEGDSVSLLFGSDEDISERVIFPVTESQSNGIEDARFVAFDDHGSRIYYATYTAYSGRAIRSELIETHDFQSFRLVPLRGAAAKNKGMALFPRRINGRYAMVGRQDNENLYLILSDDLTCWEGGQAIVKPQFPWEFVQMGNCGAPIELDQGWLLLTHGVGPVRKYSIGAVLLDKSDPSKVLGRTREPLIRPEPSERHGYVPNVVYTCGAILHNDQIVLPYAVSDTFSKFATFKIDALMSLLNG